MVHERYGLKDSDYETANPRKLATYGSDTDSVSVIQRHYNELDKGVIDLQQAIDTLEERLALVLAPASDGTSSGERETESSQSPLACELRNDCRRVERLTNRVRNIINRLEV